MKATSTPASFSFKGLATKHTTVKKKKHYGMYPLT